MNYQLSIIVAIANNNAIGKDNNLLAYLSNDLKWFKKNTLDKTVIMGRKTFDSLPNGALPKRTNIVLTRNKDFKAENCIVLDDFQKVFNHLNQDAENFIMGGAEIYRHFLPFVDKLYITRIHADFDADVFFPEINFDEWNLIEKIENKVDEKHKFDYDFLIYLRK
ncbi:MAG: dihydrofolate reductase [Bacteroidales bacterium]|nr:dihydrofolate reductase [Bacteroidales bacterium]